MKLKVLQSDIATVKVDVIVNAANTSLLGGGGVDGAIHRKGGAEILEACRKIRATQGKCNPGEAVITTAGNLPAKYVIHAVGPVWNTGGKDKERLLANCYLNSLRLAIENDIKTIAFPNISTGIYKFPKELAAKIAIETVMSFQQDQIEEVIFVCFDEENYKLYDELLRIKK
ncbi:O-acetyl-ADP-ribose deacetylase [Aquimarina sp. MMG015]|uniref:O-acetyl-ADP-ribose deacetylase n=1 Tax=Aquimarina sp. MMG015 TaxID=2822689 RepID=UPI001B3A3574|nr:O-acetyl-ADP-ribose deacetylase [Aquimarina sp. MMG015]MBQ4803877.1 O-acetyl-ADP-ribose deacetylase [Aquimarina sp. MMG015]